MDPKGAPPDLRVAKIAAQQHGVVSIDQLRAAGLSHTAVRNRHHAGRLHRVHRGVYAVGHSGLSIEGRWMAAVLALGAGAILSHRSAAELWGLLPATEGPVHVSLTSRVGRAKRPGIRIHRPAALAAEMLTRRRGIPTTTPARTIADLGRSAAPSELRRAIRQAGVLGLSVADRQADDGTRSELEHRFLRLCRRHRLPEPEVNVTVAGLMVDFLWRQRRVIVETDGYRFHRGRAAFENDRARDLELTGRGYAVIRLTHRQVVDEPARVAEVLHRALTESDAAR